MNQIALYFYSSLFVMLKMKIIFKECDGTKLLVVIFYVNQFINERIKYILKNIFICAMLKCMFKSCIKRICYFEDTT